MNSYCVLDLCACMHMGVQKCEHAGPMCTHIGVQVYMYIYINTMQNFPSCSLIRLLSHAFGIHYLGAPGASGPVPWLAAMWFIEIIWQGTDLERHSSKKHS